MIVITYMGTNEVNYLSGAGKFKASDTAFVLSSSLRNHIPKINPFFLDLGSLILSR